MIMRIVHITAGAASMYCGSCLRDNALAAELLSRGHDVILVPIYTPTLTDEDNVSQDRVFFGGISVYLEQHSALFRHTPWLLDKLWDSSLALKLAARRSIPVNPRLLGELTVSMLKGEEGFQRKELLKLISWLKSEPPPDLVTLPNALLISLAGPIRKALDRPVSCTLQGEDLFLAGLQEPYRTDSLDLMRSHVSSVDMFVPVSHYYAEFMSGHLGIPAGKIEVVPLGINLEGYDRIERSGSRPFTLGFFARVAPEKGLHLLCEAYRRLRERGELKGARLEVAGYLAPEHKPYLEGIERQMGDWGLAAEFHYRGVLDRREKIEFLQGLDVLSVPAIYDEPKGLFLFEAMACGVPVVQPRRGAFTEVLDRTGGGILVEPDDPDSLAEGLLRVAGDSDLARELGDHGYQGVREYYSVAKMADRAVEVYKEFEMRNSKCEIVVG
jgi:glycosyltransferase involved in cell wall biosynthesis